MSITAIVACMFTHLLEYGNALARRNARIPSEFPLHPDNGPAPARGALKTPLIATGYEKVPVKIGWRLSEKCWQFSEEQLQARANHSSKPCILACFSQHILVLVPSCLGLPRSTVVWIAMSGMALSVGPGILGFQVCSDVYVLLSVMAKIMS